MHVRWRCRLSDATPLLAAIFVESRRFYDGRSRFVHAYLQRAAAYQRITALSSASIELHPHQIETARRVLNDATQRLKMPRLVCRIAEWSKSVPVSHGNRDAFSTGSHAQ